MEYATKFNELSHFAPDQITTEERKMDHFEQGLRGDIRSMIAGQTFDNFHDMYQRAIKIARVLKESKRESQALALGKRKMEPYRKDFWVIKGLDITITREKENNLWNDGLTPSARHVGGTMRGHVTLRYDVLGVVNQVI